MQPHLQISRDAQDALREFSDEFRGALALADFETWAGTYGLLRTSDNIKTTWPIPLDAAGYKEFKGDIKFRSLYHRSLSMVSKKWTDGVQAPRDEIIAPDFIGWTEQPGLMANEWARLPNEIVAGMLEENPNLDFYRDPDTNIATARALFADDHPFNVLDPSLGTFDNDITTTVALINSGAFFETLSTYFRGIKGPGGKPLGLRMSGGNFLVPGAREMLFKKALENDTLIRAVSNAGVPDASSGVVAAVTQNNIHKGTMGYTVADELTEANYFYAIAAGKPGLHPWVVQQGSAPEEIVHDESSELYKRSLQVGVAYVGQANVAAALPHRIVRVQITG